MITEPMKTNLETLKAAFLNNDICLMECMDLKTEKPAYIICATQKADDGMIETIPFAEMINENPFERYLPPQATNINERKEK